MVCYAYFLKENPIVYEYKILKQPLKQMDTVPYLGVHLTNNLHWKNHVHHVVAKAKKTHEFLRCNLHQCTQNVKVQAYLTLVWPILEGTCSVLDPYKERKIASLEKFQRTVKFMTNCANRESECVRKAVQSLQWNSQKPNEKRHT